MHHCWRSKKLLKTWKRIREEKARNTIKLGSTSPSLNQEPDFLVEAPSLEAEENCKSYIKGLRE
jgi:hypothetical protein